MSEHTKEPWFVDENNIHIGSIATLNGDDTGYSEIWHEWHGDEKSHKANARRIVACVNACAEIPTEDLEESSMTILQYMEDQYAEKMELAKQQRDELLAAAKFILKGMDGGHIKCAPYIDFDPDAASLEFKHPSDRLREAIAKAEA
jgi:hypothetical protein